MKNLQSLEIPGTPMGQEEEDVNLFSQERSVRDKNTLAYDPYDLC